MLPWLIASITALMSAYAVKSRRVASGRTLAAWWRTWTPVISGIFWSDMTTWMSPGASRIFSASAPRSQVKTRYRIRKRS
jgi:hypothetical protein